MKIPLTSKNSAQTNRHSVETELMSTLHQTNARAMKSWSKPNPYLELFVHITEEGKLGTLLPSFFTSLSAHCQPPKYSPLFEGSLLLCKQSSTEPELSTSFLPLCDCQCIKKGCSKPLLSHQWKKIVHTSFQWEGRARHPVLKQIITTTETFKTRSLRHITWKQSKERFAVIECLFNTLSYRCLSSSYGK